MTELTEQLKEIYDKYAEVRNQPAKRAFGDMIKGMLSSHGKETHPIDAEFIELVSKQTEAIKENGDADDISAAAELILSQPRSKKFRERDATYIAVYGNVIKLIPLMTDDAVKKTYAEAEQVPKQYRFPVYKELKQKLAERMKNENARS